MSGLSSFVSTLVTSHRYLLFQAYRFNSNIGLPIPSAKPWQNAARARKRRPSDPRTALRPVLFTSSDPPSHRGIRLGCPGSGRCFVQALPSAIVARIVMADQANCLGCEPSVYTHPFVTVRRSLRTRFAIGQRSIFVSFAVKHCQVPPTVPSPRRVNVKMWQAAPVAMPDAPNNDIRSGARSMIRPTANFATAPSLR